MANKKSGSDEAVQKRPGSVSRKRSNQGEAPVPPGKAPLPIHPPKPNRALMIISGVLMVGWMIFLLIIAILNQRG